MFLKKQKIFRCPKNLHGIFFYWWCWFLQGVPFHDLLWTTAILKAAGWRHISNRWQPLTTTLKSLPQSSLTIFQWFRDVLKTMITKNRRRKINNKWINFFKIPVIDCFLISDSSKYLNCKRRKIYRNSSSFETWIFGENGAWWEVSQPMWSSADQTDHL